jgi:hypothetical protein
MNFLDTYDLTGSNTPPQNQPDQTLNEEVSQVIGQLGRLWGGVRKQARCITISFKMYTSCEFNCISESDCP